MTPGRGFPDCQNGSIAAELWRSCRERGTNLAINGKTHHLAPDPINSPFGGAIYRLVPAAGRLKLTTRP